MAFDATNPNLRLWLRLEPTDPALTKGFTRGGGFRGTAVNATAVVKKLTEAFGPVGSGWGYEVLADDVVPGGIIHGEGNPRTVLGHESVQRTRIRFWYFPAGRPQSGQPDPLQIPGVASFQQVGQTTYVGWSTKSMKFTTDEEAWKKSLTDAITKAASHIGIAADIHLGLFDDNKYVNDRTAAEAESRAANDRSAAGAALGELQGHVETLALALADASDEVTVQRLRGQAAGLRPRIMALPKEAGQPLAATLGHAIVDACRRVGLPDPATGARAQRPQPLGREPGDESEESGATPRRGGTAR